MCVAAAVARVASGRRISAFYQLASASRRPTQRVRSDLQERTLDNA